MAKASADGPAVRVPFRYPRAPGRETLQSVLPISRSSPESCQSSWAAWMPRTSHGRRTRRRRMGRTPPPGTPIKEREEATAFRPYPRRPEIWICRSRWNVRGRYGTLQKSPSYAGQQCSDWRLDMITIRACRRLATIVTAADRPKRHPTVPFQGARHDGNRLVQCCWSTTIPTCCNYLRRSSKRDFRTMSSQDGERPQEALATPGLGNSSPVGHRPGNARDQRLELLRVQSGETLDAGSIGTGIPAWMP